MKLSNCILNITEVFNDFGTIWSIFINLTSFV